MPTPPFLTNPTGDRQWSTLDSPPWRNDPAVANTWRPDPIYMSWAGAPPNIASWAAEKGGVTLTPVGSTPTYVNYGYGRFGSVNTAIFDGDGLAAGFSGTAKPFSFACLMTVNGVQVAGRFALAFGNTANTTSTALSFAFTGTNANFRIARKNDAGTLGQGNEIVFPTTGWHVVEAHFDGTHLLSYLDGVVQDDGTAVWDPGGACNVNTFCLSSYRGSGGRATGSTARFAPIVVKGGAMWDAATRQRIRTYLQRLQTVTDA
jgi:hypothetical protein